MTVMQCLESGWAVGRYEEEYAISTFNSYFPNVAYMNSQTSE